MTGTGYHEGSIPHWITRQATSAELAARTDGLTQELLSLDEDGTDATFRELVAGHLRSYAAELEHRTMRAKAGRGPAPRTDLAPIAREVALRGDPVTVFLAAGHPLTPVRRGDVGGEWCGPCPSCGGTDRLRVFKQRPGEPRRFWCRRCNLRGDVVDAWMLTHPGGDWISAVLDLAHELNVPVPEPPLREQRVTAANARRALQEVAS